MFPSATLFYVFHNLDRHTEHFCDLIIGRCAFLQRIFNAYRLWFSDFAMVRPFAAGVDRMVNRGGHVLKVAQAIISLASVFVMRMTIMWSVAPKSGGNQ